MLFSGESAAANLGHVFAYRSSHRVLKFGVPLEKFGGEAHVENATETPGFWTQLQHLARREALNVVRDKVSLIARVGTTIFINLLIWANFYYGT